MLTDFEKYHSTTSHICNIQKSAISHMLINLIKSIPFKTTCNIHFGLRISHMCKHAQQTKVYTPLCICT